MSTIEDYMREATPEDGVAYLRVFDVDAMMVKLLEVAPRVSEQTKIDFRLFIEALNDAIVWTRMEGKSRRKKSITDYFLQIYETPFSEKIGVTPRQLRNLKKYLTKTGHSTSMKSFKAPRNTWVNVWHIQIPWKENVGKFVVVHEDRTYREMTDEEVNAIYKEYRFKQFVEQNCKDPFLEELDEEFADIFDYKRVVFADEDEKLALQNRIKEYFKRRSLILKTLDARNMRIIFENLDKSEVFFKDEMFFGVGSTPLESHIVSGRVNPKHIRLDKIDKKHRKIVREYFINLRENFLRYKRRINVNYISYMKDLKPSFAYTNYAVYGKQKEASMSSKEISQEFATLFNS